MTVANQTNRISAVGNAAIGQEVPFSFPYAATSDIKVYSRVTATGVETVLAETTNYTLTAASDTGGTLTTVTAVAATAEIHIIRDTPKTQALDLEAGGSFSAEDVEDALDKNTKLIIENYDAIQRCVRAPETDAVALNMKLPNSIIRASENSGYDASGNTTTTESDGTFAVATAVWDDVIVKSPWVDVRAYGAVGDGTTDDAAAIQAAFDALSNGDTIYFPNTGSDYVIKSAITCDTDNIRIIGGTKELGSRLDFQSMAGADGLTLGGYGLYIENINCYSSDSSTDDGLVLLRDTAANSLDHTLVHCEFSSHGGDGLVIARPQTTVLIGCKSVSNGGIGFNFDGSLNGGGGGTSVTCIGCWSGSNTSYGCHVKSITGFDWTGGANAANTDRAFQIVASEGISVHGVDGEGATGGFALTDGTSSGISFNGIYIAGVGVGKIGISINASEAVTVDNISFKTMTGDHFNLNAVVGCHIGTIIDLDDGDASGITFGVRTGSCTRSDGQVNSITSTDTTPSVTGFNTFKTANASATIITDFDNPTTGQIIKVIINDNNTTIDFTAGNLIGNGGSRWFPKTGDSMICTYDGAEWYCVVSSPAIRQIVCNENQLVCNINTVVTN